MKKINFISVLLFILIGSLIFILTVSSYFLYHFSNTRPLTADKQFKISKGENFSQIVKNLEEQKIISSGFTLKLTAKLTNLDKKIYARNYIFKPGMGNLEILKMISNHKYIETVKLRILEGWTIRKISETVENRFGINKDEFIKETSNPEFIKQLGLEGKVKNLEGFLFPDTYTLDINSDANDIVKILVNRFNEKVINDKELMKRMNEMGMNLLETVTLGSIIDAETHIKSELEIISGVYHNRLKKKMRLEADPTVQYALPDGPKERLLFKDLEINSPYNTYRNFGLPPGPINNPGLDEIKSAVNPAKHNYIFFVATGDGGHTFSETYEKHLKAAEEYRKKLK
ncbi:MAG TPA: endolytic transglycosylase MltG [Ignavibacteria bacterium]|nr:endolytic transglycosylase MltG [Ignavibacteria bacterium]